MNLVKLQDTKVNIQKSLEFLYSNNEKSEREIKEINPFTTISKRIKYLGTNLPKETKDLYFENFKMLMKEVTDVPPASLLCFLRESLRRRPEVCLSLDHQPASNVK